MKRIRRITHACFQRKPIRIVHHRPAEIERKRKRYRNMNKVEKTTYKDLTTTSTSNLQTSDSEYERLVSLISGVWEKAKKNAAYAVNAINFICPIAKNCNRN